ERLEDAVVHVGRRVLQVAQLRRVDERPLGDRNAAARRLRDDPAAGRQRRRAGAGVAVPGRGLRHAGVVDEVVGELRAPVARDAAALALEQRLAALGGLGQRALVEARHRRVELLEVGPDLRAEAAGLVEAAGGPRAVHGAGGRL